MKQYMNAQKVLAQYTIAMKNEFPTLYGFLLYTTGGDFGLFDNSELISDALVSASIKETMLQTINQTHSNDQNTNHQ